MSDNAAEQTDSETASEEDRLCMQRMTEQQRHLSPQYGFGQNTRGHIGK